MVRRPQTDRRKVLLAVRAQIAVRGAARVMQQITSKNAASGGCVRPGVQNAAKKRAHCRYFARTGT